MQARQQAPAGQPAPAAPSSLSCPWGSSPSGGLIEECRYYNDDGQLSEQARSSDSTDQTYSYDTDGNRTQDERGTETYNPLDQEIQWVRGGPNTQGQGGTVTYTHDGDGALLQETDNVSYQNIPLTISGINATENANEQLTIRYCSEQTASTATGQTPSQAQNTPMCSQDAGRVENVQTTSEVTGTVSAQGQTVPITAQPNTYTQHDCYDTLGQLKEVVQSPDACGGSDPNPAHTSTYSYNATGQVLNSTVPFPSSSDPNQTLSDSYLYDAIGRRYQKTETISGQNPSTSNYAYLGLSTGAVTSDNVTTTSNTTTNSYDYNSHEQPTGLFIADSDGSGGNYYSYATDANGSVSGLEDSTGTVATDNQYHYTPYGELELGSNQTQNPLGTDTPQNTLTPDALGNQVLFEGFQYNQAGTPDPAVQPGSVGAASTPALPAADSYTTPARNYLPGQASYQTPDNFEQSTATQTQATSPLTQDPYTFAAGNPTSNVELEGHFTQSPCGGGCQSMTYIGGSSATVDNGYVTTQYPTEGGTTTTTYTPTGQVYSSSQQSAEAAVLSALRTAVSTIEEAGNLQAEAASRLANSGQLTSSSLSGISPAAYALAQTGLNQEASLAAQNAPCFHCGIGGTASTYARNLSQQASALYGAFQHSSLCHVQCSGGNALEGIGLIFGAASFVDLLGAIDEGAVSAVDGAGATATADSGAGDGQSLARTIFSEEGRSLRAEAAGHLVGALGRLGLPEADSLGQIAKAGINLGTTNIDMGFAATANDIWDLIMNPEAITNDLLQHVSALASRVP